MLAIYYGGIRRRIITEALSKSDVSEIDAYAIINLSPATPRVGHGAVSKRIKCKLVSDKFWKRRNQNRPSPLQAGCRKRRLNLDVVFFV